MRKVFIVSAVMLAYSTLVSAQDSIEVGKSDAPIPKEDGEMLCETNPYQESFGIKVVQQGTQVVDTDTYITCNWLSDEFEAAPNTLIGFRIMCPNDSKIINSGYLIGAESQLHTSVSAAVAVPMVGADAADVGLLVHTQNPKKIFQLITFTLCRSA